MPKPSFLGSRVTPALLSASQNRRTTGRRQLPVVNRPRLSHRAGSTGGGDVSLEPPPSKQATLLQLSTLFTSRLTSKSGPRLALLGLARDDAATAPLSIIIIILTLTTRSRRHASVFPLSRVSLRCCFAGLDLVSAPTCCEWCTVNAPKHE